MFIVYFSFLQDQIIEWQSEEPNSFNWCNIQNHFIRISTPTSEEIENAEARLAAIGYHLPNDLKAFWREVGCGYFSGHELVNNGLEQPKTDLDIYLCEGDWANIKSNCNLLMPNELPFLLTSNLDYITIGLEEGVNLGKIYRFGVEIAPNLIVFIQRLLENPTYYLDYIPTAS